ncbi:uncharacterized protein GLRG_09255 [Colletotrichum graminicola M1.001]|uniref:Rhodopsin domain-containing protein n=1 Tax=Colletotrichum graminicola (strain M1.001 / M2 / FGSC 10212) TaxID=645133 RepID=E3QTC3_COLGM|nr:uncharacterized protein GLRG_09255 [Colletotrichum graminicola M1.001]EFQ34111.1 hypothetical protein GLRG_09255 [Colletotrichum graminicola M1.001]
MALPPPPEGLDLGESRVQEVTSILLTTWTLSFLAVSLRFLVRRLRKIQIWPEDWIIIVSLVAAGVHVFTTIGLMIRNGTGKHIWVGPPIATKAWATGLFISEIAYTITLTTIKCSTLMFYWRIFGARRSIRILIWILFGVVMAWCIAVLLVSIFQCIPTHAFWDRYDPVNPMSPTEFYCGVNVNMFFNANSIPNIITDAFVVMLPIPYVLSLQMSKPQKLALLGVFLLGTFVTIISMVRLHTILSVDLKSPDITWNFCSTIIWTNVEANIAIVCACLPSLKPLLSLLIDGTLKSTNARGDQSSGSYALSNGARFGGRYGNRHLGSIGDTNVTVKGSCPNHGNASLGPAVSSRTTNYGSTYLGSKVVSQITVKGACPGSEQDEERPFTRLSEGRSNSSIEEVGYNDLAGGKPAILVSQDFEVKSIINRKP